MIFYKLFFIIFFLTFTLPFNISYSSMMQEPETPKLELDLKGIKESMEKVKEIKDLEKKVKLKELELKQLHDKLAILENIKSRIEEIKKTISEEKKLSENIQYKIKLLKIKKNLEKNKDSFESKEEIIDNQEEVELTPLNEADVRFRMEDILKTEHLSKVDIDKIKRDFCEVKKISSDQCKGEYKKFTEEISNLSKIITFFEQISESSESESELEDFISFLKEKKYEKHMKSKINIKKDTLKHFFKDPFIFRKDISVLKSILKNLTLKEKEYEDFTKLFDQNID